jgi:lipopolysaccharide transport system ATP-binding protein
MYKLYDRPVDRLKESLHPFKKQYHRPFYALKNIELEVKKGEVLGVVGRNGAGKSTLLSIISGVLTPTSGQCRVNGRISPLLSLATGFNPELTGIENIYLNGTLKGYSKKEMDGKRDEILDFADIGRFIEQPLKIYSSGMKARLAFALAVNVDPEILIVDEVLAVGDDLFKRKCYARMEQLFHSGCTVLFVSHSTGQVNDICTRAILIDGGEIITEGSPKFVTISYDKFLFCKPHERDKFRQELLAQSRRGIRDTMPMGPLSTSRKLDFSSFDDDEADDIPVITDNKSCIHEALYLPEFQTGSKIINKNVDIEMLDLHISTMAGKKVNYLFPNDFYNINYRIQIGEGVEKIFLACVFKTEKGLVLSGARYPAAGKTLDKVLKNTIFQVKLKFKCSFLPGNNYIDIGVITYEEGEKRILFAEYDALVFKVQNCKCLREKISSWGYFSLEPEIDIETIMAPDKKT